MENNNILPAKSSFFNKETLLLCVVLFLATFILYGNSLNFAMTGLDDASFIKHTAPNYKSPTAVFEAFNTNVLFGGPTPYYRPFLSVSFILSDKIAGNSIFFAHFINILLHALSVLLIFVFCKRYLFSTKISFLAALLFAFHPITIYTASWIPGRNDSLFLITFILAFIFFIEYLNRQKISLFFISLLFTLITFFTKESAIVLPFIFIFYFLTNKKEEWKIKPYIYIAWFAAIFIFLAARKLALYGGGNLSLSMINLSKDNIGMFFDYFSSAVFFRTPFGLNITSGTYILGSLAFIILCFFAFFNKNFKEKKALSFYLFLPFFFLLPNIMGERLWFQGNRMYAPLFAIIIIFFSFLSPYLNNAGKKKAVVSKIIVMILIVLSFFVTYKKQATFKNGLVFWEALIKETSFVSSAHYRFYGLELIELDRLEDAINSLIYAGQKIGFADPELTYILSNAFILKGDYNNAAKALEIIISQGNYLRPHVYGNIFIVYHFLNDEKKANDAFSILQQHFNATPDQISIYLEQHYQQILKQRGLKKRRF